MALQCAGLKLPHNSLTQQPWLPSMRTPGVYLLQEGYTPSPVECPEWLCSLLG